jgi:hypothetical protein
MWDIKLMDIDITGRKKNLIPTTQGISGFPKRASIYDALAWATPPHFNVTLGMAIPQFERISETAPLQETYLYSSRNSIEDFEITGSLMLICW